MSFRRSEGFTLVELLVVIAIISVLAALLMPALEQAMLTARLAACASNHKQVYLASALYADDYAGMLPIARKARNTGGPLQILVTNVGPTWGAEDYHYSTMGIAYKEGYMGDLAILDDPGFHMTYANPYDAWRDGQCVGWKHKSGEWEGCLETFENHSSFVSSSYAYYGRGGYGDDPDDPNVDFVGRYLRPLEPNPARYVLDITSLQLCRIAGGDPDTHSHGRKALNALYVDGHVRTFAGFENTQTLTTTLMGNHYPVSPWVSDGIEKPHYGETWWNWVVREDN